MRAQFDHALNVSFSLYAANRIQQEGQAFFTVTTPLYYVPDTTLPPTWLGYSAPWKQFLVDSGISGAVIINSVSGGGFSAPLTRASGIHIDYVNGRVLVPSTMGTNMSLTGTASFTEISTYQPNSTEEATLTTAKYFRNPRFNGAPTSGVQPNAMATPMVVINTLTDDNDAFAFGGLDTCATTFSIVCYVESDYQLKGLFSLFRDARYGYFPLLGLAQYPLDGFNDVKGGTGYNYQTYVQQYGTPGNLVYIADVHTAKLNDRAKLAPGLWGGVIDVDVEFVRQTL